MLFLCIFYISNQKRCQYNWPVDDKNPVRNWYTKRSFLAQSVNFLLDENTRPRSNFHFLFFFLRFFSLVQFNAYSDRITLKRTVFNLNFTDVFALYITGSVEICRDTSVYINISLYLSTPDNYWTIASPKNYFTRDGHRFAINAKTHKSYALIGT